MFKWYLVLILLLHQKYCYILWIQLLADPGHWNLLNKLLTVHIFISHGFHIWYIWYCLTILTRFLDWELQPISLNSTPFYTIIIKHTVWFLKSISVFTTGRRATRATLFVVHQLLNASPGSLRLSGAFHLLSWRRRRPCPGSACQDLWLCRGWVGRWPL